jgi:hypothetical protein
VQRCEAKRVSKAAVVWGICGGVLAESGGKGGVGDVVVIGMGGKVGGVAWQMLRIRERGRGDKNKKSKSAR